MYMDIDLLIGILNNALLLISLGVIYFIIPVKKIDRKIYVDILTGIFIGGIVSVVMLTPFKIVEGVLLDTRSIAISVTGLFFGLIPGLITIAIASLVTLVNLSDSILTDLMIIIMSGSIGYIFKHYRFEKMARNKTRRIVELYALGLIVHIVMVIMLLFLPSELRFVVINKASIYILLIFPFATVLFGSLMFVRYDISNNNELLIKSNQNFIQTISSAPIPMVLHAEDGTTILLNKVWTELSGYSIVDIPDSTQWAKKAFGEKAEDALKNIKEIHRSRSNIFQGETKIKTKGGEFKIWDFYNSSIGNLADGRKASLSVAIDITAKKKIENELVYMSFHDELTGVYNRRFYSEEVKRLNTKRNYPLSILIGDVNGLKIINDSFGHLVGDKLLKDAADAISRACRADDIIARVGGDEFVVLLPKTNLKETEVIIKRIHYELSKLKIKSLDVSISFGSGYINDEKDNFEKVFIEAENKMYQNKLLVSPSIRGLALDTILSTLFEIDKATKEHSEMVSSISKSIAEALELSSDKVLEIQTAALLHDIGKIVTPDLILKKMDNLTESEFNEMKKHPEIGFRILSSGHNMEHIAKYVLYHHERIDGKGYPNQLTEDEIPLESKIIAVADAFDAMTSGRFYRPALSLELAIEELKSNIGSQFCENVVNAFINKVLLKDQTKVN